MGSLSELADSLTNNVLARMTTFSANFDNLLVLPFPNLMKLTRSFQRQRPCRAQV